MTLSSEKKQKVLENLGHALGFIAQAQENVDHSDHLWSELNEQWEVLDSIIEAVKEGVYE